MRKNNTIVFSILLCCVLLGTLNTLNAQSKKVGKRAKTSYRSTATKKKKLVSRPASISPVDVRERTLAELLYFPFGCLSDDITTMEEAHNQVSQMFGACERININPGLHAGKYFDFTYRNVPIGTCFYNPVYDDMWYHFYFDTKQEAQQFYNNLSSDLKKAGIPLEYDKIYGGLSSRRQPVSIFKWVAVNAPELVKVADESNIHLENVVGKYQVEFFIYKRNTR